MEVGVCGNTLVIDLVEQFEGSRTCKLLNIVMSCNIHTYTQNYRWE